MAPMAHSDSEPEFEGYGPKTSKSASKDISNEVRKSNDAPMVEKLVSDDKSEKKIAFPIVAKIEFVKSKQQEKPVRKPVKYAKMYMSQKPKGNQRNWNNQKSQQLGNDFMMHNKACYVCGSFDHLQYTCKQKRQLNGQREEKPMWNNARRGNLKILLQDHAVVDSGCSSHMTGNKAYLSDYEDFNGGFVAFGSDLKGGKITGKGKIKTANLDFDDVYFVDELKFNLFSISQMCDKKNSVLFTESECLILSPSFKLLDES
ncbi:hypothetical protein Tco_0117701 [Tanacetum coccineum]